MAFKKSYSDGMNLSKNIVTSSSSLASDVTPKNSLETAFINTPVGMLRISADAVGVTAIDFAQKAGRTTQDLNERLEGPIKELKEYFSGKRSVFTFKMNPRGTEFQKQVWKEISKIPAGKTLSYSEVAKKIKRPKAFRAVAMALHRNPIGIVVPCHRVIGKSGSLTGYAGGLSKKSWLLDHEKKF